jgi:hypothetical protein
MIVTKKFGSFEPSDIVMVKQQLDAWLSDVQSLESPLDKIGTFIYSNGEADDREYSSVKFMMEIKNDK